MKALQDLQLFVRTARAASFSEAARALNLSPAAVSAAIKRLEAELGLPLFLRSTRQLRLTLAGEQFLQSCEQGLELITQGHEALCAGHCQIQGRLHVALPSDLGRNLALDWLLEFRHQHRGIELRLQVADRLAGLLREQLDLALRYGAPPDSGLVALPLAPQNRRLLVAAPAYLQRRGRPTHPEQLREHDCLCFAIQDQLHRVWRFERGPESLSIEVGGPLAADDGDAVRRLAVAGEGIAYKSALDVAADLQAGRLERLCPDWLGEPTPLVLLMPERRSLRPALRALIEHLQGCVQGCVRALA